MSIETTPTSTSLTAAETFRLACDYARAARKTAEAAAAIPWDREDGRDVLAMRVEAEDEALSRLAQHLFRGTRA